MVCDTANWINLHHDHFKMRGLTVSEPMRLDCLLAAFVLLGMMKGNDPDVGDFFSHTWTIYAYPSPLSFKKAFIILHANGWHFVLNSRVATEPLCSCSSSCRNRGGSAAAGCISSFGWKQGRLVDTLPYIWKGAREPLETLLYAKWELFPASTTSEKEREEGHQASLSILSTLNRQDQSGSPTI